MSGGASERFDVIVVGAGAAGCVLAADLAADGRRVLLLDAGPADETPALRSPNFFPGLEAAGRTFDDVRVRRVAGAPPTPYLLGRGIGGGTAVNGMVCAVEPSDFDRWGIPGWRWADVVSHAARLRAVLPRVPADQLGPVDVALYRAATAQGVAADIVEQSLSGGERLTALDIVLVGRSSPPGLVVRSDAEVARVIVDGARAVGVELVDGTVIEAAEVVVAAGAIHTPLLLMRSGIDAPQLGVGLTDHPSATLTLRLRRPAEPQRDNVSGVQARWGDVQALAMNHVGVPAYGAVGIALMRPRSSGWVDADGAQLDMFDDERDLTALRDGVRLVVAMLRSDAFAAAADAVFVDDHGTPIDALDDDAYVDRWLREGVGAYVHASSSCRIGVTADAECRVVDYDGLRICDASIFPTIPSTNPMLPTMILGARLAELMRTNT